MRIKITILMILLVFPLNIYSDVSSLFYPNAKNKILIDTNKIKKYRTLSKSIGFKYGTKYSYSNYADIKRKNKLGSSGSYDFLMFSTGGNGWDDNSCDIFNQQKCGWETTYYSNHNLTIIHEICHDDSRTQSFVRILKICKGKNPNLNIQE